jgi:hypothetical protein
VAVISGTSVGGMNSVGVTVGVGGGSGVGELNRQRKIRLAKPRQYMHDVVKIATAINRYSNLWRWLRRSYLSKSLLTRFPLNGSTPPTA